MYIPGIKTVIYMVSLQNKFQEQNEILDRKGSNCLIYFLFLSYWTELKWMTLYWYAIIVRYKYDYILLSYCSTILEWQKIKECLYLSHSAASPALGVGRSNPWTLFLWSSPLWQQRLYLYIINCLNVSQIISTFQKPCITKCITKIQEQKYLLKQDGLFSSYTYNIWYLLLVYACISKCTSVLIIWIYINLHYYRYFY